ncbi:D-alanyl-lipoteichoic acid biosynthesis protein DltD [Peptostreptococcus equinus]|uniref:Protein DltD n=1 Tax=Peptostreptococcus equinus TaxID=3003601 RepID=A0ABY7JM16_9FIRM|nr:D-alanyl-lipoteichoic acid biosynthesis protein DltD [Peptostreptococcus sp. CBA3647]WAW14395.1 D-alanyl-lipoteichoic acid biosynthesis protein DltD [Peptostreptococcus sp. CBA3647]
MKNVKKIKYILLPIVISVIFTIGFNKFLDVANNSLLKSKDLYPMLHNPVSLIKDKGVYANNKLVNEEDYILMMGSSEFSHSTLQHPDYYFDTNRTTHGAITVGRAYTQSLQHSTVLGSLDNLNKDKKVVLILSMQWFMEKNGVTKHHFETRFSPVQFYKYLENPRISKKNKIEYTNRVKDLLCKSKDFKAEHIYASIYNDNSPKAKAIKTLFSPYFSLREYMVGLKDKGILFEHLLLLPDKKDDKNIKKIDWEKEKQNAIREAVQRVGKDKKTLGNSDLSIDKGYYNAYIKPNKKKLKNFYAYVDFHQSQEYNDLKLFMDTCKDLGVKPTIVLVPAMDGYYTYTGIDKNERQVFFDKTKSILKDYNYTLVDTSDKGETKYYLRDVMHLGTLGWVDVSKKIYDIYER